MIYLLAISPSGIFPNYPELSLWPPVQNPIQISPMFLGQIDLSGPNIIFAILAGIVQFFQTKMLMPQTPKGQGKNSDMSAMIQKQMLYIFPVLTVVILFNLPSALGLYWTVSGIFSVAQQYFIFKKTA